MKIRSLINVLETTAPLVLQESYDNSGLIYGSPETELTGVLVSLDLTMEVAREAVDKGCNLVVSHHPLVFQGLKRISEEEPIGRILVYCIRNGLAIYALHTNLDNTLDGVNQMIARSLHLTQTRVLSASPGQLRKLVTYIPLTYLDKVREAVWKAGAGRIGTYDQCGYSQSGQGTFRAGEGSNPFVGELAKLHMEEEYRFETVFPAPLEKRVVRALLDAHPYEEVAYDLYSLGNDYPGYGAGLVGKFAEPMDENTFLTRVRTVFGTGVIRHSALRGRPVQVVAICGGSGSFLINNALSAAADVFLTADLKYHDFFLPDNRMLLADMGHYESEQFTSDLIAEVLREKFPNFAVLKTSVVTNPVHYFYT